MAWVFGGEERIEGLLQRVFRQAGAIVPHGNLGVVAASQGAGMMIMTASKFQNTDIVIMGIILIGVIGFGIDMLMRYAERLLVPWKGKA